jgi:hypothetical protein
MNFHFVIFLTALAAATTLAACGQDSNMAAADAKKAAAEAADKAKEAATKAAEAPKEAAKEAIDATKEAAAKAADATKEAAEPADATKHSTKSSDASKVDPKVQAHHLPWPPPQPFQSFVYDLAGWPASCVDRAGRVNAELTRTGYDSRFLYLVDKDGNWHEGIALITGLELVDEVGRSLRPHSDASLDLAEVALRGIRTFFGPPNHKERMFVFVLSPEYFGANFGPPIARPEAARLFQRGILQAPVRQIAEMCHTEWLVTALVYEFDTDSKGSMNPVDGNHALGARIHLVGAGIRL